MFLPAEERGCWRGNQRAFWLPVDGFRRTGAMAGRRSLARLAGHVLADGA